MLKSFGPEMVRSWPEHSNMPPWQHSNNFETQVYTPPYLLKGGTRPKITPAQDAVHLGANLTFTSDGEVTDASLLRYGGATHTVYNNQRPIYLELCPVGAPSGFHY